MLRLVIGGVLLLSDDLKVLVLNSPYDVDIGSKALGVASCQVRKIEAKR